jgi:predicted transcriptional regulator of viral defense system
MSPRSDEVVTVLKRLGVARSRELTAAGVNPKLVATALRGGFIERMDRGTYCLPGFAEQPHAGLLAACKRVPGSVVCLQSAAYFHGLINEEQSAVWLAIDSKSWRPSTSRIALKTVWFSGDALSQGVVSRRLDGVPIRVFSPMKTIADLLKYRNKIGVDVALQSLRASVAMNQYSPYRLLHFARICRVEKLATELIHEFGSGRAFAGRQVRSVWRERV